MITISFGNDYYYFQDGDWYGIRRGERSDFSEYFPGSNVQAPLCIYSKLLLAAIDQGHDESLFSCKSHEEDVSDDITEETEKPRRKSRGKKKSNSISIF